MTTHLRRRYDAEDSPICGAAWPSGEDEGEVTTLISIGAGQAKVCQVDCRGCWELMLELRFYLDGVSEPGPTIKPILDTLAEDQRKFEAAVKNGEGTDEI
jgi:hypothetical protein